MIMINRQGVGRSLLFCGFAWLVACSSDNHGPFVDLNGNGGASASGNRTGTGGASHAGAGGSRRGKQRGWDEWRGWCGWRQLTRSER